MAETPKKENLKELFIGDYDWAFLCTPRLPWGKPVDPPPLYGPDDPISIFVAILMGAQHALAMVGGIITVPFVISGKFNAGFTPEESTYIISAALIVSGISSLIQVSQFKIPGTKLAIGSGMLSVMGISFTFLPIAQTSIAIMKQCACDGVSCRVGSTCNECTGKLSGECNTGQDAYGRILGTVLVTAWLEVGLSFMPTKVLRRLFPPVVSGSTIILIGVSLTGVGFKYWGGGVFCADQVLTSKPMCDGNGEVKLPFGAKQYIGLGFSVFATVFMVEMFGSPFMRNISVICGLLVGMIIASASGLTQCTTDCDAPKPCAQACFALLPGGISVNPNTGGLTGKPTGISPNISQYCYNTTCPPAVCRPDICVRNKYVTGDEIANADWVTFLWVHRFKLGFYGPAVLPMLFAFMVTTMECIGDVTATAEASGLVPVGERYETAVKGGILADGLNSFWGALATMLPVTTFAQNNGIISLTRCGSRRAGWACGCWLILLGVIAKFAAIILTIPDAVLGGMTTFLFVNVVISGIRILQMGEGITRRNRFIAAMALALGLGVNLVPEWVNISGQFAFPYEGHFWPVRPSWSKGFRGFRDALIIVMSTGFSIGGFTAVFLNLVLPRDKDDHVEEGVHDTAYSTGTAARQLDSDVPKEQVMSTSV